MRSKIDPELLGQVHNYDVNPATREIYLHSHFSSGEEEGGVEFRMATTFVKNMHVLQAGKGTILVHLQSPGGDWSHGMAIFDAIRASAHPVVIVAHGELSSMSGIIYQAANVRVMMPSCELMVHRGFLTLDGVSTTVQANAAWNKKTDLKVLQIYASRAVEGAYFKEKNMTGPQVLSFIDKKIRRLGDWNLDAEQAVHFGLADGIYGSPGFESLDQIRKNYG